MKKKLLIKWILVLAFLQIQSYSYGQYQMKDDGLSYVTTESSENIPYDPAWARKQYNGFFRAVALRVTSDYTETHESNTWYQGGMTLRLVYPVAEEGTDVCAEPLPVVVYGYGGGYLSAISDESMNTPRFIASQGYIVVVPVYRIGINLTDTMLAERAIWRSVQDIQVVNKYAREITDNKRYCADKNKPLSYVGWSAGALTGLHNIYLGDEPIPTSIDGTYEVNFRGRRRVNGNLSIGTVETAAAYDLGPLFAPRLLGPGTSEQFMEDIFGRDPIPEINVCISGALGNLDWINSTDEIPYALMLLHHPDDAVVPAGEGPAFAGYGLFNKPGWVYPTIFGSEEIHKRFIENEELIPTLYAYRRVTEDCDIEETNGSTVYDGCLEGNAGGVLGPLNIRSWNHDPSTEFQTNNRVGPNVNVLDRIVYFLSEGILSFEEDNGDNRRLDEVEGDTYLIIGQSNAAGRGELPAELTPYPGVSVLDDSGEFIPATPNLNEYSSIRKTITQGYNFGYTFGGSMAHITGEDVKLIVNAQGGTDIRQWQPGADDGFFEAAVERVNLAKEADPDLKLAGVLWHQGESNRSTGNYVELLGNIIDELRIQLDEPELPLVAGQLAVREISIDFNERILELPNEVPFSAVAETDASLATSDSTHFTTEALRTLGDRYALKMSELQGFELDLEDLPIHEFEELTDTFQPDITKTYHIRSLQGRLLAADPEERTVSAVSANTVGPSVEWKFVEHFDSANYHLDLASGGTYSRISTSDPPEASLTQDQFEGTSTYFSLAEREPGSEVYHITAIDEADPDSQRLFLNPNGTAGLTDISATGSWSTFEIIEVAPSTFEPDPTKTYHIRSLQGRLLAADAEADETSAVSTSTVGPSVEWKFVERSEGLYHIDLASGGTNSRLFTDRTAVAAMTQDRFIGPNTYFQIAEREPGSGVYHITAIDEGNQDFQRLFLNPNGVAGMSDVSATGSWSTFEIEEVEANTFEPDLTKTYNIRSLQGRLLAADAEADETSAVSTSTVGPSVEWKFVERSEGLYHIDLANGGTNSRLFTDRTAVAAMTQDRFIGPNTYFQIAEREPGSEVYHITAIDEGNQDFQRLFLNPNGVAGMSDVSATGSWSTFEIEEVQANTFEPDLTKTYHIRSLQGRLLAGDPEEADGERFASAVGSSTVGVSVEWKFVEKSPGLYHVELASGGTRPRLFSSGVLAGLTRDQFTGPNTYFQIAEREPGSEVYHFTAIDEGNPDIQRLFLNPNGVAGMTDTSSTGSWSTFEIIEVDPVVFFEPDLTKTYHIRSTQGRLLAADAEADETSAVGTSTVGSSVEWKFVEKAPGLYHVDLASGGTNSRLFPDGTAVAAMTQDRFTGSNTYFQIAEKEPGSGTYHITAIDEDSDLQRLFLNPNGVAGMTDTSSTGSWSTFEIIEVDPLVLFEPNLSKTYHIRSLQGRLLAADAEADETSAVGTSTVGPSVEWKFVEKAPGLYHVDLASGGTNSRLFPDGTAVAAMTQDRFTGSNTYFQIAEKEPGSGTYHFTAIDEDSDLQRLFLNPNGVAGMTDTSSTGTWATFEIIEVDPVVLFKPDLTKTYHIRSLQGRILSGDPELDVGERFATAVSTSTNGASVEWKFVEKSTGLYHIDLASGGTRPRLFSNGQSNALEAGLTKDQFTGSNTYFQIIEKSPGSNTYHITAIDEENQDFQRLYLNPNGIAGMTDVGSTGTWSTFEIIEVFKPEAGQHYYLETVGSDSRRLGTEAIAGEDTLRKPVAYDTDVIGGEVEWIFNTSLGDSKYLISIPGEMFFENLGYSGNPPAPSMENSAIIPQIRILETATGSGLYHLTFVNLPDASARIRLNAPNNAVQLVDIDNVGDLASFKIIPVPSGAKNLGVIDEISLEPNANLLIDFTIAPNPVTNIMTIKGLESDEVVEIYDLLGKKIIETTDKEINLSHYESGLYFVRVAGRRTLKMIKK